jgi:hypothetical protein
MVLSVSRSSEDFQKQIEAVLSLLQTLKEGEFKEPINKVGTHISSIGKGLISFDEAVESARRTSGSDQVKCQKEITARETALQASTRSSLRFARMNLDLAMSKALDKMIRRPKSANKVDESKRKQSLRHWFDQLADPAPAMLEHFKASSNPLDKWLVAGQWGHDYMRTRHIDMKEYDRKLCELIPCSDGAATGMVLCYGKLNNSIDAIESGLMRE